MIGEGSILAAEGSDARDVGGSNRARYRARGPSNRTRARSRSRARIHSDRAMRSRSADPGNVLPPCKPLMAITGTSTV
jgi:hypothetical protein